MNKLKDIDELCKSLKLYFDNAGYRDSVVLNVYHEIIDDNYCTKYNIEAPVATYRKNGPHIYIDINKKNGFGIYSDEISFNKALYDKARYWAELLSPDFFMIFSPNIKDADFTNFLFCENKSIILNGFKSRNGGVKKTPIYIIKTSQNLKDLRFVYYDIDFNMFLDQSDELISGSKISKEKMSVNDAYIAGNIYGRHDAVDMHSGRVKLRFNNLTYVRGEQKGGRIKLKFFNKIRDLERRLQSEYGKITLDLGASQGNDGFIVESLYLDIYSCKAEKIVTINLDDYPPIYTKAFIRGFIDSNYTSLEEDYYTGNAGIKKDLIDNNITRMFQKFGSIIEHNRITIGQDLLEVRRDPFIKKVLTLY